MKINIENIESLSGHAEKKGLIDWMGNLKLRAKNIYSPISEAEGSKGLQNKIRH